MLDIVVEFCFWEWAGFWLWIDWLLFSQNWFSDDFGRNEGWLIRSDLRGVWGKIWRRSLRYRLLSTYAKFSVVVTFFTHWRHEGTCACQGVGNVTFRGHFVDLLDGWFPSTLNYGGSLELFAVFINLSRFELALLISDYIFVIWCKGKLLPT